MRTKILMRFAKKVSEVILVFASIAALLAGIYAVGGWVRENITRETAFAIEFLFFAAIFFFLVLLVIVWLVEQYDESVKEIEKEQRYDDIARESRNQFEQQRERVKQGLAEARERMTT